MIKLTIQRTEISVSLSLSLFLSHIFCIIYMDFILESFISLCTWSIRGTLKIKTKD